MIFTTGFLLGDVTKQKANQYRSVKFVGADQNYSALTTNLAGVNFEEHEGAYLAGVVAALSTNATYDARLNGDNKIAFVGGMDIPPVERFEAGFVAGAQSVNYGIDVIGEYAGSFTDEARGEELAEDAIAQGADVVFAAAGATGLGCIQACQDHGALFIGVDNDQYLSIPGSGNVMLTSAMKRLDNAAYGIIEDLAGGTFVGGSNLYLGLAEDAVGVAPYHDFDAVVPQSIRNAVEAARAAVIGYVTVPDSRADLLGRTYLGMGVNPTVLPKYDATTTITGRLTFGSGITVPLVGEDVRIQTSSNGKSGWKTVKMLPSGFNGQFSWVTVPRSTAYYRLSYAGKTYRYASVNSSVMFKVVPKAYVGPVGGSRYGARSYTLYGTLKPKHANHTKPVLVYRWQRVAGHWKKYGTHLHATVHDRGSFMRYEVKYRFPHKGTWQLRAYHPADSGQAATWGGYSELKVK
jgi:basic membrane protein A